MNKLLKLLLLTFFASSIIFAGCSSKTTLQDPVIDTDITSANTDNSQASELDAEETIEESLNNDLLVDEPSTEDDVEIGSLI
jgi:predicted component of type VI protein secretion system